MSENNNDDAQKAYLIKLEKENAVLKAQAKKYWMLWESVKTTYLNNYEEDGDWYCPLCKEWLGPVSMTHYGTCNTCGAKCKFKHVTEMCEQAVEEELAKDK